MIMKLAGGSPKTQSSTERIEHRKPMAHVLQMFSIACPATYGNMQHISISCTHPGGHHPSLSSGRWNGCLGFLCLSQWQLWDMSGTCHRCRQIWRDWHTTLHPSSLRQQNRLATYSAVVQWQRNVERTRALRESACTESIPSGQRLHNYRKIHHFVAGKTHYFYGHGFQFAKCNKLPFRVIVIYIYIHISYTPIIFHWGNISHYIYIYPLVI